MIGQEQSLKTLPGLQEEPCHCVHVSALTLYLPFQVGFPLSCRFFLSTWRRPFNISFRLGIVLMSPRCPPSSQGDLSPQHGTWRHPLGSLHHLPPRAGVCLCLSPFPGCLPMFLPFSSEALPRGPGPTRSLFFSFLPVFDVFVGRGELHILFSAVLISFH